MEKEDILKRQSELQKLYLGNMQKIKYRMRAIEDIKSGKRSTTYNMTNIEFCVLQTRKILELIALSALISDKDVYNKHLNNIDKMWNPKYILSDIERIHPDFYPVPIRIDLKDKSKWNDAKEPYLTKEEFVRIYDRCGKYLHESSLNMTSKDIYEAYNNVYKEISHWIQLIVNLLWTHTINLYNQKDLFYIALGKEEEPPHGNIFTRID